MATTTVSTPIPVVRAETVSPTAIADPGPLGLSAFALTTFVLSCANAGLIPKGGDFVVLGLALAYGGLAQFCAGMWEFKRNNTFGATAFTSYAGFWISLALLLTFYIGKIPANAVPASIGTFLFAWGIFTVYMTIAAARISRPLFIVFVLLTITFFVLAAGAFGSNGGLTTVGGYLGIATALAAWYVAAQGVLKSV